MRNPASSSFFAFACMHHQPLVTHRNSRVTIHRTTFVPIIRQQARLPSSTRPASDALRPPRPSPADSFWNLGWNVGLPPAGWLAVCDSVPTVVPTCTYVHVQWFSTYQTLKPGKCPLVDRRPCVPALCAGRRREGTLR